jgi:anti-anti-sigma factor
MSILFTADDEQLVCSFSGRMDTVSCMEVKDELKEKVEKYEGKVVFDMEEVDYISSSFLRICVIAVNSVENDNFSIIKVSPNIKKVFMIAGLADKLSIC